MTRKRPDYTEARKYYIKGEGNENPTLQDIATEFNYSLSTLRKQAANEGWLTKRKERLNLKDIIEMRKEFMGKASKLTNVSYNAISAAEYIINKIQGDQKQIELGNKIFDVHIATKQIWALNNAMKLVERGQQTLDEIENGYMSPIDDYDYI
ncbi:hypothetical protein OA855_03825 [Pelagibacteraceae bacterium]|nr:hypothetical protein [Pelagibacteraceae bacterium]